MHGASALPPWCHDVASVAVASVATDAGNAASLAAALAVSTATLAAAAGRVALPACSINSSYSSNSKGSDMIGGVISPVLSHLLAKGDKGVKQP